MIYKIGNMKNWIGVDNKENFQDFNLLNLDTDIITN